MINCLQYTIVCILRVCKIKKMSCKKYKKSNFKKCKIVFESK